MTNTGRWTVVTGDELGDWEATNGLEIQRDGLIADATDGDYLAELDAHQNTSITTSINTSDQDSVRVEFDYNPRRDGNSSSDMTFKVGDTLVTVHADGSLSGADGLNVQIGQPDANGWYKITAEFEVQGDVTDLTFAGAGASDSYGALLDNITVTGINQSKLVTAEDTSITISFDELLANDTDIDGDELSIVVGSITSATNGELFVDYTNNTITFTPDTDYNGEATFKYKVTDGNGGEDEAEVTLNITPVNDAPVLIGDLLGEVDEEGSYTITAEDLGYTDVDDTETGVTFTVGNASNGTILVGGVPSNNFTVAQLAAGEVTFKHDGSETTSASFDVNVEDGNEDGSTPVDSTFNLTVTPVNDTFVDANESVSVTEDSVDNTGNLLTGTSSPDGEVTVTTFSVAGQTANAGENITVDGKGTIRIDSDGTYTFTPEENYNGEFPTVAYTMTDGLEVDGTPLETSTLDLTVTPVNDTFVDSDESVSVTEDSVDNTGNVLTGTSSPDGEVAVTTFSVTGQTANAGESITVDGKGTIRIDSDGTYTFTPEGNYDGAFPTVTYTMTDGLEVDGTPLETSMLDLAVTPVNDTFVDADESVSVTEDSVDNTGNVLTGTSSPDGEVTVTTFSVAGQTANAGESITVDGKGTIRIDSDGTYTFTPEGNYNGEFPTVTYTMTDGLEVDGTPLETSTLDLTVTPVNDAPVAISDSYKNVQETILLTESFENMANPAGWTVVSKDPSEVWDFTNGIEIERDGLIVDATEGDFYAELDPHKNTVMTTSIDTSDQDSLRVEFDYNPRQDGNSSSDMTFTVGNTTITLHADGTVTAPEGISVTLDGPDNKGWYQVNAEFDVSSDATLIAFAGAGKSDSLGAFIDNITVTGIDAPKLITEEDQALTIRGSELLANDFDIDGDDITIFSVNATDATNGSVQLIDGNVVFEPNQDFNGEATFEYTIVDTHGEKSTTTVTVNVTPVNDDPIANDDSRALGDNLIVNGSFEDYESVSNAGWGSRIDQLDGWSYDARTGALDSVQEGYAVNETDGDRMIDMEGNGDNVTLTQQIQGVESGILYQLSFDTAMYERLPSAELEVIWNGEVIATITPESNIMQTQLVELLGGSGDGSNTLSFREVGTEGDKSGTYLDNIKFQEVIKNLQTQEDITLDIPSSELLSNDSDVDGDTLIILDSLVIDPTYGQVELVELQDGSQTVRYTPADDFNGIATFTYTVSDGKGGTDTAVVTINVTPENDAPIFVKDGVPIGDTDQISVSTKEDNSVSGKVTATDIDDTDLTYTVSQPTNGSVEIDPETGEWKYTPNNEFDGDDSFVVTVSDGNGGTDTVTVNVDVLPVAELTVTAGLPVTEGDEAYLSFDINLDELVSENVGLALTLGAAGDSATKGVDYEDKIYVKDGQDYKALSEQELADLIIASGSDSLEVFIKVLDDKLLEGEETVTLKASSTSEFVENDKQDSDIASIVDEADTNKDTVTVGLTGPDSVIEGDKTSPFTITLSEQVPEDSVVTLQYSYTNASNEDIVEVITVNVDANTNTATFEIQTEEDNEYEVGQEFNVSVVSVTQDGTDVFEKLDTSSADKNVAIDDSHDNPPQAEDFSISLNADGSSQVIFDTGMGTIEGDGTDHISDNEDDNDNDADTNLGVIITELPDSGTLYYVDGNNKVEVVVGQTYADPNNIVYEDDQESTGFFLGVDDTSTLDKGPHSTAEFHNWGDEVDAYTRELKFDNGDVVTITSEGRNNVDAKPLVQNNSQQGHMGFGIASTNRGIHQDEAINIDLSSRPADSVTVGLSGLGGWFAPNADDSVQSRAEITVTFDYGNGVTEEQTFLYDDTHNNQNVTIVAPEGAEIVSVEASTQGPGNWELTSLEAKASDSFEYKAVDSDGNESEVKTVTIGEGNTAPFANDDPDGYSINLGKLNGDDWSGYESIVSAYYQNSGEAVNISMEGDLKMGVDSDAYGGPGAQIQYNRETGDSEQLVFDLAKPSTEFSFTVSNLFKDEGGPGNHEQGKWVAYFGDTAVASGMFIANETSNTGSYSFDTNGEFAFDRVVFEAVDFVEVPARGEDSSDYFVTGFSASSESGAHVIEQDIDGTTEFRIPVSELLSNDVDADGDEIRITYVFGEQNGDAYIDGDEVVFNLDRDHVGPAEFKYQITDDKGGFAEATVKVIVNPVEPNDVTVKSIEGTDAQEGDNLVYKVTLSEGPLSAQSFKLTYGGANDSADKQADVDLSKVVFTNGVKFENGQITVPVGVSSFSILVPALKDGTYENPETFSITLGEGSDAVSDSATISNIDELELTVQSAGDVAEGSKAVFAVNLSNPSPEDIDVSLAISLDGGDSSAEADDFADVDVYTAYYMQEQASGEPKRVELDVVIKDGKPTVTIPNGETEIFVEVATKDDPVFEGGEDFNLVVTDESGYVSNGSASDETTIMDDGTDPDGPDGPQVGNDDRPVVDSITDIGIEEGLSGSFVVELSNSSELETTIEMSLNDGSAVSVDGKPTEGDFNASSVIVSFGEGENKQSETIDVVNGNFIVTVPDGHESFTVEVVTNQDTHADNNEKFSISGNAPHQSQAVTGVATITDNEAPMVDLNGALYDIEFVSEGAGYSNVFGYYINDESGEKQLHVLVSNSNDPSLSPGTLLDSPLSSIDNLEFFLIPNGFNKIDSDKLYDLKVNDQGQLVVDGVVKAGIPVYTSTDEDHQISTTVDSDGNLVLSFDDQKGQGNDDNDFNDFVIKVSKIDADGIDFNSAYVEGGEAAIADIDADIFDDKDAIKSMSVTLTNAKDGDNLTWAENSGFSVSKTVIGTEIALIIIHPSGSASADEFETFLKSIRFVNSSDTPDEEMRLVNVTVFDGVNQSVTATASISVTGTDVLSFNNVAGLEDQFIDLNISVVDAATSVSTIELSGIPQGATVLVGGVESAVDNSGTVVVDIDDIDSVKVKAPEHSDVNFDISVTAKDSDEETVESGSIYVDVHPDADRPTLIIGDFEKVAAIDFEDVQITSGSWDSDIEINNVEGVSTIGEWSTSNPGQHVEVGTEGTYLSGSSTNQVMEIEGEVDDKVLYTDMDLVAGRFYNFKFDIAARDDVDPSDSDMEVSLFKLDDAGNPIESSKVTLYDFIAERQGSGWQEGTFTLPVEFSGKYRLVLEADEADSTGAIIDNIQFTAVDNYGYEDSFIKLSEISASLVDATDGSETLTVELGGLPVDSELIDGTGHKYIVTEANKNDKINVTGWDLAELQIKVSDPSTFDIEVIATATEADTNKDDDVHGEHGDLGGKLANASEATINITVLERPQGPVDTNERPIANGFPISSDTNVANVNFALNATDTEDDASSTDGKYTSVRIEELPEYGKLYLIDDDEKIVEGPLEVGSEVLDSGKVVYVADGTNTTTFNSDFTVGNFAEEHGLNLENNDDGVDKLELDGVTLSGGTFESGQFTGDGATIKYDHNNNQKGLFVSTTHDSGTGKETQIGEYVSIASNEGDISSAKVSFASLDGLFNNGHAQIVAYLFRDGKQVDVIEPIQIVTLSKHDGYSVINSDNTVFDEIRLVGVNTSNKGNGAGFNVAEVDVDVVGVTDLQDEFTYSAKDSDNQLSLEPGTVTIQAKNTIHSPTSGIDSVTVQGGNTLNWPSSAAVINSLITYHQSEYDDVGGAQIDVGIGADFVNLGSGSDTIFMGDSISPTQDLNVLPNDFDSRIEQFSKLEVSEFTYGDENNGMKGFEDTPPGLDVASGGGGNDRIYGEEGQDIIFGGTGNDVLHGGTGNDAVRGGSGDDIIVGGLGDDILVGDDGADLFQWVDQPFQDDVDTITDFDLGEDHLDISQLLPMENSMSDLLEHITIEKVDNGGGDKDLVITISEDATNSGQTQTIILDNTGNQFDSVNAQGDGSVISSDLSNLVNQLFVNLPD
ncbi:tandem-95 repeat protein [Vibrio coralliirubri]|uniref:tandem-95 repeat protein n=1 Tax=Vibrio coralliirubri TaxID=1516159 RepID=UPI001E5D75C4|nr:tandem-95 repeat protein [Vibrio coralliirubri]